MMRQQVRFILSFVSQLLLSCRLNLAGNQKHHLPASHPERCLCVQTEVGTDAPSFSVLVVKWGRLVSSQHP